MFWTIAFMSLSVIVDCAIKDCVVYVPGDSSKCQTCATNFIQNMQWKQCVAKIPNCDFASTSDPKKCGICSLGYVVGALACIPAIANCQTL